MFIFFFLRRKSLGIFFVRWYANKRWQRVYNVSDLCVVDVAERVSCNCSISILCEREEKKKQQPATNRTQLFNSMRGESSELIWIIITWSPRILFNIHCPFDCRFRIATEWVMMFGVCECVANAKIIIRKPAVYCIGYQCNGRRWMGCISKGDHLSHCLAA